MEIRYHLDESVPNAIGNGLRLRGIDVSTAKEAGLLEASDAEHVNFAHQNQRVIFSFDDDFLSLASQGAEHSGIVSAVIEVRQRGTFPLVTSLREWSAHKPSV